MKIPGQKEQKKPKKEDTPQPTFTAPDSTKTPIPPSYRTILKEKREWSQTEITNILKLQKVLFRRDINLNVRDFRRLWHDSNKKCAITNFPFDCVDNFCIGIEPKDKNDKSNNPHNHRFVLLPLAYSKSVCKDNNLKQFNLHETFTDDPVPKFVIQECVKKLVTSDFAKLYMLGLTPRIDQNKFCVLNIHTWIYPFPGARIRHLYHNTYTYHNVPIIDHNRVLVELANIVINLDTLTVEFRSYGSPSLDTKLSLCDPYINYGDEFIKFFGFEFNSRLCNAALRYLEGFEQLSRNLGKSTETCR